MDILLIIVSGLLVGTLWAAAGLIVQSHDQIVPLHYTIYFGIDLTASADRLYLLPAFGSVIWLGHLFAAQAVKHDAWRQTWLVLSLLLLLLLGAVLASLVYFQIQV